ncbi:MAG: DUF488 domain-containing protein [Pseudomonadota bacterium]
MEPAILTIGYEKATQDAVIARLTAAGVTRLVDVRAVAASRRAGFAKTALAAGLAEAGIAYTHLRALGTPKPGREAARKGRIAEMRVIYDQALEAPEAVDAFAALADLVQQERCALLCFEAEAEGCHRRVLTERLSAQLGLAVIDL